MHQRKPNARRRPPSRGSDEKPQTSQSMRSDISEIVGEQIQEHVELFQMKVFPPFMKLPSIARSKLPAFNPLARHSAMSPFQLEKFDSEILDPAILYSFVKKVKRTQPLYDLDELIEDFCSGLDEQDPARDPRSTTCIRPSKLGVDPLPPHNEQAPPLYWYSNANSTSARKLDRLVQAGALDQYCAKQASKDVFVQAFMKDKEKRDEDAQIRLGLKSVVDVTSFQLPWLDYSSAEAQSSFEKSEWQSTVADANGSTEMEIEHNLNRVAELFTDHLEASDVEYLCILLSGVASRELTSLTDTLQKLALLLGQHRQLDLEFPQKSSLIKRKLTRLVTSIVKLVNVELLTIYDSYLDEIFKKLCDRMQAQLAETEIVDQAITGHKELQRDKAHKTYKVPVHQLKVEDAQKESYYDAYQRLTSFTIN